MDELLSFFGVLALWIGASFGLWGARRLVIRGRQRRQIEAAAQAVARVHQAQAVFDDVGGGPAPADAADDEAVRQATLALLGRIETHAGYFDAVAALRQELGRLFPRHDCPALAEILHLRRDLWAAADMLLVDDLRSLGDAFAEEGAYECFCAEARGLLFKTAGAAHPVDLRLSLVRGDIERFARAVETTIRRVQERERLPTVRELLAYLLGAAQALPGRLCDAYGAAVDFWRGVMAAARGIRRSRTMIRGLDELRRARDELPGRLSAGLARTPLARQSAGGLGRHYDFIAASYALRARYREVLAKAPVISEKGRQFIARLDLAQRSERLRLASAGVAVLSKRLLVLGLARAIMALQRLHDRLGEAPSAAADNLLAEPVIPPRRRPSLLSKLAQLSVADGDGDEQDRKGDGDDGEDPGPLTRRMVELTNARHPKSDISRLSRLLGRAKE